MNKQLQLFQIKPKHIKPHPIKPGDELTLKSTGERVTAIAYSSVPGTTIYGVFTDRLGFIPTQKEVAEAMTDKPCSKRIEFIWRNIIAIWPRESEQFNKEYTVK